MLWRQGRPRLLWNVSIDVQVTNERVLGFQQGPNPIAVPEDAVDAIFHYRSIIDHRNVNVIRCYGSLRPTHFPGSVASDTIWQKILPVAGTAGLGQLRQPAMNTVSPTRKALRLLPPWLLLEYSTAAIGTDDLVAHFVIDVTWLQPPIAGVS